MVESGSCTPVSAAPPHPAGLAPSLMQCTCVGSWCVAVWRQPQAGCVYTCVCHLDRHPVCVCAYAQLRVCAMASVMLHAGVCQCTLVAVVKLPAVLHCHASGLTLVQGGGGKGGICTYAGSVYVWYRPVVMGPLGKVLAVEFVAGRGASATYAGLLYL